MKKIVQFSDYRRQRYPAPAYGKIPVSRLRVADEFRWEQERDILRAELAVRDEELQLAWREVERQSVELRQARAEAQRAQAETAAVVERYTDFYDCSPVAYFTLEPGGNICHLNRYGAQLLGAEGAHLIAKRFGLFVEPSDRGAFNDFVAAVFAAGKASCTVRLAPADGRSEPLLAHLEAIRRGLGRTCSLVAIDLTERQRAEAALARYQVELESTIAERTAELSAANQELEGFVYAASHDMKGPLARLSSLSALLGQQLGGQVQGEARMVLDLIQQNADRLNALVEDLLAHAQIRQQPLSVQCLDLAGIARAMLQELADAIRQKGAEVRLDLPSGLAIRADALSIGQILRNLIDNALKYSEPSRPPLIEVGARVAGETCRLWVRDNGIGIEPRYHERIFEIFRRLHTYSEYPGTGVGLALVKKAIERMGGRVWVESELGQGAIFHLEWPSSCPSGD